MDDPSIYRRYLRRQISVVIDRPLGSKHPTHDFVYPINYGYMPGTMAGDGQEIDVYVLGETKRIRSFTGRCIAIVLRCDDVEHKLVAATCEYTVEQIQQQLAFVEAHFDSTVELAS